MKLQGKKVAILATDGFEQVELTEPKKALEAAGAKVQIVSPKEGQIRGWNFTQWGISLPVDVPLNSADPGDFDALMLPGGQMNPDNLRTLPEVQKFVRAFFEAKKPVGAICHAPWILIDSGIAKGRKLTSYHTIKTDLVNAGAQWMDQEVVVDNGLVTSRNPGDLPAFCNKLIEEIAEGIHA